MTEERYDDDDLLFDDGDDPARDDDFLGELDAAAEQGSEDVEAEAAFDDDDLFLIDGLESGDDSDGASFASPQAAGDPATLESMFVGGAKKPVTSDEPSPEDVLFDAGPGGFQPSSSFQEHGGGWDGHGVDLEELVGGAARAESDERIEVVGDVGFDADPAAEEEDLFQIEDVEVELVDGPAPTADQGASWGQLRPIARDPEGTWAARAEAGTPTGGVGGGSSLYDELQSMQPSQDPTALRNESVEIGAETWDEEPVDLPPDHEEYDPIYGQDSSDEAEQLEEQYYEEDWSDYEDEYVDEVEHAPGLRVVGPGRRRSRIAVAASIAATVLVAAGGGAVAWLKPEWLGLSAPTPIVSRVEVARPTVAPELVAPVAPELAPVEELPEDPPQIEPVEPVEPVDPVVVAPPVEVEPEDPPVVVAQQQQQPTREIPPLEALELGDELEVREAGPIAGNNAPFSELPIGTRAFAQLHNSEFFIGTVKKRDAQQVTLRLTVGEVSLDYASLRTLAPLGDADTGEVTEADDGYVRLDTEQRLFGTLIRTKKSDEIILRTEDSRITVPSETIVDVGIAKPGAAVPLLDDDDDWLDARARERLLGTDGEDAPTARPTPGPRSR